MITVTLTPDELALLREALDSHLYWQVSPPLYRESGYVNDPRVVGDDDEPEKHDCDENDECVDTCWLAQMDAVNTLDDKLHDAERAAA